VAMMMMMMMRMTMTMTMTMWQWRWGWTYCLKCLPWKAEKVVQKQNLRAHNFKHNVLFNKPNVKCIPMWAVKHADKHHVFPISFPLQTSPNIPVNHIDMYV
jgi:hypothetical protein